MSAQTMRRLVELARAKEKRRQQDLVKDEIRRKSSHMKNSRKSKTKRNLIRTKTATDIKKTAEQKAAKRMSITLANQVNQRQLHVRAFSLPKEHTPDMSAVLAEIAAEHAQEVSKRKMRIKGKKKSSKGPDDEDDDDDESGSSYSHSESSSIKSDDDDSDENEDDDSGDRGKGGKSSSTKKNLRRKKGKDTLDVSSLIFSGKMKKHQSNESSSSVGSLDDSSDGGSSASGHSSRRGGREIHKAGKGGVFGINSARKSKHPEYNQSVQSMSTSQTMSVVSASSSMGSYMSSSSAYSSSSRPNIKGALPPQLHGIEEMGASMDSGDFADLNVFGGARTPPPVADGSIQADFGDTSGIDKDISPVITLEKTNNDTKKKKTNEDDGKDNSDAEREESSVETDDESASADEDGLDSQRVIDARQTGGALMNAPSLFATDTLRTTVDYEQDAIATLEALRNQSQENDLENENENEDPLGISATNDSLQPASTRTNSPNSRAHFKDGSPSNENSPNNKNNHNNHHHNPNHPSSSSNKSNQKRPWWACLCCSGSSNKNSTLSDNENEDDHRANLPHRGMKKMRVKSQSGKRTSKQMAEALKSANTIQSNSPRASNNLQVNSDDDEHDQKSAHHHVRLSAPAPVMDIEMHRAIDDNDWKRNVPQSVRFRSSTQFSTATDNKFSTVEAPDIRMWEDPFGKGAGGRVYKGVYLPLCQIMACKVTSRLDKVNVRQLLEEYEAQTNLLPDVSQLMQIYGWYRDMKNNEVVVVSEYMDMGSIFDSCFKKDKDMDVLNKSQEDFAKSGHQQIVIEKLTYDQIRFIARETLIGLHALHNSSRPLIHRDIKPQNILLSSGGEVKVADFGLLYQLKDANDVCTHQAGTAKYFAPERLQKKFGTKSDIWSFGITLLEVWRQKLINPDSLDMFTIVEDGVFEIKPFIKEWDEGEEKCPNEFKEFVQRCLIKKPDDRPSAFELLQMPFVTREWGPAVEVHTKLMLKKPNRIDIQFAEIKSNQQILDKLITWLEEWIVNEEDGDKNAQLFLTGNADFLKQCVCNLAHYSGLSPKYIDGYIAEVYRELLR